MEACVPRRFRQPARVAGRVFPLSQIRRALKFFLQILINFLHESLIPRACVFSGTMDPSYYP
jgi:hypothetical protein